jgi:ATP-binding cassette subfamily F protein uup
MLFDGVDLALEPRVRACLVGRNGAGKSTLLRILSGRIEPDAGDRFANPGVRIAFVPAGAGDLGRHPAGLRHRRRRRGAPGGGRADHLRGGPGARHQRASPGVRPAAPPLARAFAEEPDLLLLDEPTNHLDIFAIETLEAELRSLRAAALIVSHDRAFLERTTQRCFWLESVAFAGWTRALRTSSPGRTPSPNKRPKSHGAQTSSSVGRSIGSATRA